MVKSMQVSCDKCGKVAMLDVYYTKHLDHISVERTYRFNNWFVIKWQGKYLELCCGCYSIMDAFLSPFERVVEKNNDNNVITLANR